MSRWSTTQLLVGGWVALALLAALASGLVAGLIVRDDEVYQEILVDSE